MRYVNRGGPAEPSATACIEAGTRDVRIISRRRLREFWEGRATARAAATSERGLSAWYKVAGKVTWANSATLRQTFGSADQVGNCVVFDVGNNRLRLIGRVNDAKGIIYVLKVMDHAEYDRMRWINDCGCDRPPPKPTPRRQTRGDRS